MRFFRQLDNVAVVQIPRTPPCHCAPQCSQYQYDAKQERNAPAPVKNCSSVVIILINETSPVESVNLHRSQLVHRYCKRLFYFSCTFNGKQRRASPFAADGKSRMARSVTSKIGAHHPMVEKEEEYQSRLSRCPSSRRSALTWLTSQSVAKVTENDTAERTERNPTPKVANAASVPIAGLTCGKTRD